MGPHPVLKRKLLENFLRVYAKAPVSPTCGDLCTIVASTKFLNKQLMYLVHNTRVYNLTAVMADIMCRRA